MSRSFAERTGPDHKSHQSQHKDTVGRPFRAHRLKVSTNWVDVPKGMYFPAPPELAALVARRTPTRVRERAVVELGARFFARARGRWFTGRRPAAGAPAGRAPWPSPPRRCYHPSPRA